MKGVYKGKFKKKMSDKDIFEFSDGRRIVISTDGESLYNAMKSIITEDMESGEYVLKGVPYHPDRFMVVLEKE